MLVQGDENWRTCLTYIEQCRTLIESKNLAAKEGFRFPHSVWLLAWQQQKTTGKKLTHKPHKNPPLARIVVDAAAVNDAAERYDGLREFLLERRNR
jgi:hypothetical protein